MILLRPRPARAGFTLIEMTISSALAVLIIASAYACLSSGLSSKKMIETREGVFQNARVAMALMAADLRSACSLSRDFDFLGMHRMIGEMVADNLDFATLNHAPRGRNEGDFCEVSYYVQPDPKTGKFSLWRRRDATRDPEPLKGGSKELIAEGVKGLRFEYYDGYEWYDEWGDIDGKKQTSQVTRYNITGLPEAVRVTLWLDADLKKKVEGAEPTDGQVGEPPFAFQTMARLNLAGVTSSSSSGGSSTTGGQPAQAQPGGVQ